MRDDEKTKDKEELGSAPVKDDKKTSSSISNKKIRSLAEAYMRKKGMSLLHPKLTFDVSPERGAKIAKAYEEMKHDPQDPKVKKAYAALIQETIDQWNEIKKSGLKVTKITPEMGNPYPGGSKDIIKDVTENNHLYYFPTESGYGSTEVSDHPLLQKVKLDGEEMPANDIFRIVHDVFGHVKEGEGFGPKGEENAWMTHKQMYSPEAQRALTSETRGQNSWVNFGPLGEQNRKNPEKTTYAEQKAGLLPDWVVDEEPTTGREKYAKGGKLVHYSQHGEPLETLDPSKHGTGRAGHETRRGKIIPRTYYYESDTDPETLISDSAKYRYTVKRPDKILDLASEEAGPFLSRVRDINELEELLHASGFDGYKNSAHPQVGNAVALFHPQTPVETEKLRYAEGGRVMMQAGGDPSEPDFGSAPGSTSPFAETMYQKPSPTPYYAPSSLAAPEGDLRASPTPSGVPPSPTPEPLETTITHEYVPVWDISSPQPKLTQIPHTQVTDAIQSGKFSFDKGTTVPMKLPDGEVIPVMGERFKEALNDGLTYATPKDVSEFRYGSGPQQVIAGIEGLGRGVLSAPVFTGIEKALGVDPEAILGREEANPATAMAAETLGFVAPLVLTGGAWAAEKLGAEAIGAGLKGASKIAAKAPFPMASNILGEATAKGITKAASAMGVPTFISFAPAQAARGALEMGLYAAQKELSNYMLDAPQTSDSIISAIGMSGLLGGAIGGGIGLAGQGWKLGRAMLGAKEKPPLEGADIFHYGRGERPPPTAPGGEPPPPPEGGGGGLQPTLFSPEGELPVRITPEMLQEAGITPPRRITQAEAPPGAGPMPSEYAPMREQLNLFPEEAPAAQAVEKSDLEQALDDITEEQPKIEIEEPRGVFSEQVQGGWVPAHLADAVMDGDPIAIALAFPDEQLEKAFGAETRGMTKKEANSFIRRQLAKIGLSEKPDAPAIRKAIEEITDGEVSVDKVPGDFTTNNRLYGLIADAAETKIGGSPQTARKNTIFRKIDEKLLQILGDHGGGQSPVKLGEALKRSFAAPMRAEHTLTVKPYKPIDKIFQQILLTEGDRAAVISQAEKIIAGLKHSESEMAVGLREVIKEIESPNVATVLDLRKSIRNIARLAFESSPPLAPKQFLEKGYTEGWKLLKDLESSIGKNLTTNPQLSEEARRLLLADDLWGKKLAADEKFSKLIENLRFLSKKLGARRGQMLDAESMLDFLKEVSPDVVFQKLSLGAIKYNDMLKIATDFPELANVIRSTEKMKILEKANKVSNSSRELGALVKGLKNYTKEQQLFIFENPADRRMLENIILAMHNSPAHKNFSNSAVMESINRALAQGAVFGGPVGVATALATEAKMGAVANMILKGMDKAMIKSTQRYTQPPGDFPPFMPKPASLKGKPITGGVLKGKGKPKKYAEGGMVEGAEPMMPSPQQAFVSAMNQPPHIQEAHRIVNAIVKSDKMITNSVKSIFDPKSTYKIAQATPKGVERLKGYIEHIHRDPESLFSLGSDITPEFNAGYARAASAAASYIQSLQPPKPQDLPFDTGIKNPPTTHDDIYNHVLKVAEQPLSLLHKIKQGTVIPEEVGAVQTIYPDLYQRLQDQITEHLIEVKEKGAVIPYRTKIGLSAFLGSPIDTTMTPEAIMAAQPQQQNQPPQGAQTGVQPKRSTSALGKMATMAQTPGQARTAERSSGK